eukprot:4845200-Prymnesium_polylepis.1
MRCRVATRVQGGRAWPSSSSRSSPPAFRRALAERRAASTHAAPAGSNGNPVDSTGIFGSSHVVL